MMKVVVCFLWLCGVGAIVVEPSVAIALFAALVCGIGVPLWINNSRNIREKITKLENTIEKLEQDKHELTDKLIDARMRAITHAVSNEAGSLILTMGEARESMVVQMKKFEEVSETLLKRATGEGQ